MTDPSTGSGRARQYQDRAEECRVCAEAMRDPGARAGLLQVAAGYEQMAACERAEAHQPAGATIQCSA